MRTQIINWGGKPNETRTQIFKGEHKSW